MGLISIFIVTAILGFFSAAITYKVLRNVLQFRAEWNTTFIACMMTMFVCEFTFMTSLVAYNPGPWFLAQVIGTTALLSMIAGTVACRLIIRSQSGRHLPTLGAAFLAFLLTAPPTFVALLGHLFAS